MDSSLIVSVIVAVVAIVPGVWALVNQANKDKAQQKMDMGKAAQDAAVGIIAPLQGEVARLQSRVLELENLLVEKTKEIGELMEAGIDKDSQIRTLKYTMEGMQLRLDTFEKVRKSEGPEEDEEEEENENPVSTKKTRKPRISKKATAINKKLADELKANEVKKQEIKQLTDENIRNITNGSLVNSNTNPNLIKEE